MDLKVKFELEFPIQASPQMLYQYISSASGLSEWFADNVNSRGIIFSFFWDGSEEKAELISSKSNNFVKFRWLDEDGNDSDYFFEIKIVKSLHYVYKYYFFLKILKAMVLSVFDLANFEECWHNLETLSREIKI